MSNTFYPAWIPSGLNGELSHKQGDTVEVGDLMWWDASNHAVRPASTFTDTGDGATQLAFAGLYVGISNAQQRSTDAVATRASLQIDTVIEFPCSSNTFVPGDYLEPDYVSSALVDQVLEKTSNNLHGVGRVVKEYTSATTRVKARLWSKLLCGSLAPASVATSGDITVDSITGGDSSLGVTGQAGSSSAGGIVAVAGGAGAGAGNAGGAVTVTGGTGVTTGAGGALTQTGGTGGAGGAGGAVVLTGGIPTSGNAAGGTGTYSGGAGSGTGAGGAVTTKGGASGTGATGNGGAWTSGGGAALSTNGTGGAANLTGGVATGTGTGGAVTITSGASAGASGTAGAVTIDCGALAGGTGGAMSLGATATAVTIGAASVPVITAGPSTCAAGASTAAAGSTTSDATALPAATARVYPTTAADDTKGVRVHANDKVTGRMLFIGNGVSNKILKVYAPSGGAINGASADAAFSSASGKGVIITCLDSTGNTWLAF